MSVTLSQGSSSVTIKQPYYGYQSTLRMGLHYSRVNGAYKIRDDGAIYDSRRCDIDTWLLPADQQNALYAFLNDVTKGRGNNITMSLGSNSGFFPFLPDKGDSGDFVCSVIEYSPGQAQLNPYLQHSNKISLMLVTAPAYTPPASENEGSLQIGTVTTLRPVQSFPDVTNDFSIVREVSRGGVVSSVDIGTSVDVIETNLSLEMRPGNAAALITYLQSIRNGDITINAPRNTWLFGIGCDSVGLNGGEGGEYTCKLLSNEIIVTHDNFNLFKTSIKLWKKSYIPAVVYGNEEIYFEDGEITIPEGELVL